MVLCRVEQMYVNSSDTLNTIFAYCHASVKLDNVDILYLENRNLFRPILKNKTATMFSLKKPFLV